MCAGLAANMPKRAGASALLPCSTGSFNSPVCKLEPRVELVLEQISIYGLAACAPHVQHPQPTQQAGAKLPIVNTFLEQTACPLQGIQTAYLSQWRPPQPSYPLPAL